MKLARMYLLRKKGKTVGKFPRTSILPSIQLLGGIFHGRSSPKKVRSFVPWKKYSNSKSGSWGDKQHSFWWGSWYREMQFLSRIFLELLHYTCTLLWCFFTQSHVMVTILKGLKWIYPSVFFQVWSDLVRPVASCWEEKVSFQVVP